MTTKRVAGALLALAFAAACSQTNAASSAAAQTQGHAAAPSLGAGCAGQIFSGHTPNASPAPLSYLAGDLGKPGTPRLTSAERSMVDAIQRHLHSPTLRVTWLYPHEFIVFDAVDGPCSDAAPGYPVLNEGCHQNEFYEPGEDPYHTGAGPTEMQCSPRPWLPLGGP